MWNGVVVGVNVLKTHVTDKRRRPGGLCINSDHVHLSSSARPFSHFTTFEMMAATVVGIRSYDIVRRSRKKVEVGAD